jgi:hypothetical protein
MDPLKTGMGRDRGFESHSLQRRVACEPEPGAAEIGSGEG